MPAGLDALAADLRKAAREADKDARKVVKRGAVEIKKTWQTLVHAYEEHGSIKPVPRTIKFDELHGAGVAHAEIGYDKGGPGSLGNLIEFGSVHNEGQKHGEHALAAEEPNFIREMRKIGDILE